MNISPHLIIAFHLLRREWRVFIESWQAIAIDTLIIASVFSLSIGYFLPEMGMPAMLRMPVFIGTIMVFCISEGYATGLNIALDLNGPQLMRYHASLPTNVVTVALVYVLGIVMRMTCIATPVFVLGITFLKGWHELSVAVLPLLIIGLLVSFFWALLFLVAAVWCNLQTMLGDIWARIVAPMFTFGCTFFPWKSIATYAPTVGNWLLINPMTHCVEGLRYALLGSDGYVSFPLSCIVLCVYNGLLFWFLCVALKDRLQVVEGHTV